MGYFGFMARTLAEANARIAALEKENELLREQNAALYERVGLLTAENATLRARVCELEVRVADLERQLRKDSKNSSKPPSTDFLFKPDVSGSGARRGGKPGHRGATRKDFGEPDRMVELVAEECPRCGTSLEGQPVRPGRHHQVAEWAPRPIEVVEYHHTQRVCPCCDRWVEAPYPPEVLPGSRLGPRLISHLALLNRWGHVSLDKLEVWVSRELGVPITSASISNAFQRVRKALEPAYEELAQAVRRSPTLHIDETGWRVCGKRHQVWTFGTERFTYLRVEKTRCGEVLQRVLGPDFGGTVISDFYLAYDRYLGQRCLAHLSRDLKECLDEPDAECRAFALEALGGIREAWAVWNEYRRGELHFASLRDQATRIRDEFEQFLSGLPKNIPKTAQRLKRRFLDYWEEVWFFLDHPDVPPHNNLAERSLRPIVTYRKVSGGSQAIWGAELTAMIHSVTDTCRKQGRRVHTYLADALLAEANGRRTAALLG